MAEILEVKKYGDDYSKILWAKIRLLVTKDVINKGWRFQQQPLTIGSSITINPNNIKLLTILLISRESIRIIKPKLSLSISRFTTDIHGLQKQLRLAILLLTTTEQ